MSFGWEKNDLGGIFYRKEGNFRSKSELKGERKPKCLDTRKGWRGS